MSKHKTLSGLILFLGLLAIVLIYVTGCGDDNIVGPVTPRDYNIYIMESSDWSTVRYYNTGSHTVDSFFFPYSTKTNPFVVSSDGRKFYLSNGVYIVIINAETHMAIDSFPCDIKGAVGAISPNGRYLGMTGDEVGIIDLQARSIIYRKDYQGSWSPAFSSDNSSYSYIRYTSSGSQHLEIVPLNNPSDVTEFVYTDFIIDHMIPSRDGKLWYTFLKVNWDYCIFRVYNPGCDSVLFDTLIFNGGTDIKVSPDDHTVYFTSEVGPWNTRPPSYKIMVYDRRKNCTVEPISLINCFPGVPYIPDPGPMYITPDGKYLLVAEKQEVGAIVAYDIKLKEFVGYYFAENRYLGNIIGPSY